MIVRVLGSAAGGGVPQWNCACRNCRAVRDGTAPRRTQSGLAIRGVDGSPWLLLNCSPDIASQIEAFPPLQPVHGRVTPIAGVLLTDANFDHVGGLAALRQAATPMHIRSSAVVRHVAAAQPSFAQFAAPPHRWLEVPLDGICSKAGDDDVLAGELTIRAIAVPGTTPSYDGRRSAPGAVVAYEIVAQTSKKRLLFAPVFSGIDAGLRAALERADVAFLDGSFYSDDEMSAGELSPKSARSMGHQPVGGAGGTLEQLRGMHARLIFTHMNNSNPMLDPESSAYAAIRALDAEIAYDGMELTL